MTHRPAWLRRSCGNMAPLTSENGRRNGKRLDGNISGGIKKTKGGTMTEKKDARSLGELFGELRQEIRTLIKQEMELLRVELTAKVLDIAKDAALLAIGGVILYTGFLTLIAAIVLGVAVYLPPWLSALLVAILFIIIGALLVR